MGNKETRNQTTSFLGVWTPTMPVPNLQAEMVARRRCPVKNPSSALAAEAGASRWLTAATDPVTVRRLDLWEAQCLLPTQTSICNLPWLCGLLNARTRDACE